MQNFVVPVATVLAAFFGSFAATFLASHPSVTSVGGEKARRLGAEKPDLPDSSKEELEALKASHAHLEAEINDLKQQLAGAPPVIIPPTYHSIPEETVSSSHAGTEPGRRLSGLFKAATTMATGVGCKGYATSDTAVDLNSATECDNTICPDCFYWDLGTPADVSVTFSNCHTSRWGSYIMGSAPLGTAIRSFTFINKMTANKVTITDGTNTYVLPAKTSVVAYCHTGGATLLFPYNPKVDQGCPKGCDDTTPSDISGTAFANAVNFPGACSTADAGATTMANVCLLGR